MNILASFRSQQLKRKVSRQPDQDATVLHHLRLRQEHAIYDTGEADAPWDLGRIITSRAQVQHIS